MLGHLSHTPLLSSHPRGFTLVEVMVVIVILSLFAGLMTLSVSGSDTRRNQAFYEHVKSNINYVRLLSLEAMQPYGIAVKLPQNGNNTQLVVVKLEQKPAADIAKSGQAPAWQLAPQVSPLDVPDGVEVTISPLQSGTLPTTHAPNWLVGTDAPPVVWFGTGEATPVQLNITAKHSDGNVFPVGDALVINSAGTLQPTNASGMPMLGVQP